MKIVSTKLQKCYSTKIVPLKNLVPYSMCSHFPFLACGKCHRNVSYHLHVHIHVCHTHIEELAGPAQVFFTCPSNGGGNIVIQQWDMYSSVANQSDIAMNTTKYDTSTDRLEIQILEPGDEGAYICTLTVDGGPSMKALGGCLVIYGECFVP